MTMADEYQPFYVVTPQRQTSSQQVVFAIKSDWPVGSVVDCNLDGEDRSEQVPDDQDHPTFYVVYHDVPLGKHTLNCTVTYPDGSSEDLGKFRWEIIEAHTQVPQNQVVELEGTVHGVSTSTVGEPEE